MRFSSATEVQAAYDHGEIDLQAAIECRVMGEKVKTTAGRVLFYDIVPRELPFSLVNKVMDKKALGSLIDACYRRCGQKATVLLADHIRTLGYANATLAGISISVLVCPRLTARVME